MCSFERKLSHQDMIKMIRLRNAKLERKINISQCRFLFTVNSMFFSSVMVIVDDGLFDLRVFHSVCKSLDYNITFSLVSFYCGVII